MNAPVTPNQTMPASKTSTRYQIGGLSCLFFLPAMAIASWASRMPAIRDALGLTPSQIGMVLFCLAIGAMAFFPFSAWMIASLGARRSVMYSGLSLLLMLLGVGWAPSMPWLMLAMAAFGASLSIFDVAINVLGSAAEKRAGRSIMSSLHAWFCGGTLIGALFGSLMASVSVRPLYQFAFVVVLMMSVLLLVVRILDDDQPAASSAKQSFSFPHGALIALGVIGFCAAIAEGSVGDWGGIYLKDQLHASESVAALVIAVFSSVMLLARLLGDRLKDRFGARRVVSVGALLSAFGLLLVVLAFNVPLTMLGFALSGAGLAVVFPFIFSAAGAYGGNALVSVTTISYSGGLVGPPVIGLISDAWGLQAGMAFIGALSIAVALTSFRASALETRH